MGWCDKAFQRIKIDYDVIQYPFELSPPRFNAGNRVNGLLFFPQETDDPVPLAKRHESDSGYSRTTVVRVDPKASGGQDLYQIAGS